MTEPRAHRLAVLIDADNTSPQVVQGLFDEIAKIGEASVRRIYGDFARPQMSGWNAELAKFAILPQQQFANVPGKNASDIALVIDAMDLMHSGHVDGFCLVSSDSDFTRLAARIREHGLDVYGFGAQKTPESFRQACKRFIYTENLRADAAPAKAEKGAKLALRKPAEAVKLIQRALEQVDDEEGWAWLSVVGSQLTKLANDFDTRNYGSAKLSDLVKRTGKFEMENMPGGGARIRSKQG